MWRYDLDRFDSNSKLDCSEVTEIVVDSRELLFCILRKHGNENVDDNLDLSLVCSCAFDEDIASLGRNLRMVSIDDRRKRTDHAVRIVDNGIHWRVTDDV
jgi:PIN domain nuclease of toxin-antitoxin system